MTKEVKTIAMVRDPEIYKPPYSADVHPDEVANWKAAGWREKEIEKVKTKDGWPENKGKK